MQYQMKCQRVTWFLYKEASKRMTTPIWEGRLSLHCYQQVTNAQRHCLCLGTVPASPLSPLAMLSFNSLGKQDYSMEGPNVLTLTKGGWRWGTLNRQSTLLL